MPHQPSHIPPIVDVAILETVSSLYFLISLYIGLFNVFFISTNWRRLRLEGLRGPLLMHTCLAVTPVFFVGENIWNQVNLVECRKEYWTKSDCMRWKRVRNTISAMSEAFAILFFWFRSQTFYLNPVLSGLFLSNERKPRILNCTLLALIVAYPVGYTTYSVSHFWLEHHEYNYLVDQHLCYENYTNNSLAPIGTPHTPLNLTGSSGLSRLQHKDPIPMIVSSGFQFMQLLLHFLVIIPFLVPFFRFVKDQDRNMPEVDALLKRCLVVTLTVLLVNSFSWVLSHLLAPVMPVSKFLLDAIADSRICVGIIMASSTMTNWRQVLMPWRKDDYSTMFGALANIQNKRATQSTVIANTVSGVE